MNDTVQALPSRKEREEVERRHLILVTAERLFAQSGFHATNVQDIAREAEFGVGTLYKYFNDKASLFRSLIEWRLAEHLAEVEEALEGDDDPVTLLHRFIDAQIESIAKRSDFFRIYYTYANPQALDYKLVDIDFGDGRKRQCAMLDRVFGIVSRAIDQGTLIRIDRDYIGAMIIGGLISMFHMARFKFGNEPWDIEEMKSSFKKVLFDRVLLRRETTEATAS